FQAEDGIRDFHVTGVQTCALPISSEFSCPPRSTYRATIARKSRRRSHRSGAWPARRCCANVVATAKSHCRKASTCVAPDRVRARSEERRVGKEDGHRSWQDDI